MVLLVVMPVKAQITIGGSVYGGGNAGDVKGSSSVTVYAGDINRVYGGARMANVDGRAFVHLDGKAASNYILINQVYGGNDIAGSIGTSADALPAAVASHAETNGVDGSWNALVLISSKTVTDPSSGKEVAADNAPKIYIGQLFGGGDGDYTYGSHSTAEGTEYYAQKGDDIVATSKTALAAPELGKTFVDIHGGSIVYAYGGGNNATVTEKTVISVDNPSAVVNSVIDNNNPSAGEGGELLTAERFQKMDINTNFSNPTSPEYQIGRLFGGNNKAEMTIMPTWRLMNGSVRTLYSGGNEGRMTSHYGLLLTIPEGSTLRVNDVYGGCRKADVRPMRNGEDVTAPSIEGYTFEAGLPAHVRILGGDVNNVYGGNDISGKVWGGSTIGIYHSIKGDVYGGGNGSYAYTDQESKKNDPYYDDFYYEPGGNSVEALNAFRPVTESVSIFVSGKSTEPTVIGGSIYCGGNSATLHNDDPNKDAFSELKIGPYVYADNVFMGNNGANMINAGEGGVLRSYADHTFSSLDLTNASQFSKYMEAVAMDIKPRVVFDNSYVDYTTYFGSFYGGGNVGSITYDGVNTLDFNKKIIIYNKVVGGCNNANVAAVAGYNAAYKGGMTGAPEATTGNKLVMNFNGLKIQPMRWKDANDKSQGLIWNTKMWETHEDAAAELVDAPDGTEESKLRLYGGNVYGGCYSSGYVNGNVEINILSDLIEKDKVFKVAGGAENSGVTVDNQIEDVLGAALNVFGAGYGADSEIQGNTTINLQNGYAFQTFGGGEKGNVTGDCTTNIRGGEVEYVYGGGFEGPIAGNTYVHLGSGTMGGVVGGSCNADITGHTEVYIGDIGFPTITETVNGGNDFGGTIHGTGDFSTGKVSELANPMVYNPEVLKASSYVEYIQGKLLCNIYGGNFGSFDYKNALYRKYTNADGSAKDDFTKPRIDNAFVNFHPNNSPDNAVPRIYGGSIGYAGDAFNNMMQDRSYVLVDIASNVTNFATTEVFGAGDYAGIGIAEDHNEAKTNEDGVTAAAIIDLVHGRIGAAYGGSYQEGTTRRTIVNVPQGSTIVAQNIFGGAYGLKNNVACDVYETTVNYNSPDATVTGALYGGNNNCRRTLYSTVNVNAPVWSDKSAGYTATVYGAGYGARSWSRNTTVNLNNGAEVYEVYGGGNAGMVLNIESEQSFNEDSAGETIYKTLDGGYTDEELKTLYAHVNPLDKKTNTNVYINKGATVVGYCYGGGLGATAVVSGKTYIGLHGGTVKKDLYAGGTSGGVEDKFAQKNFMAEANAYIEGGSVRNVYGGGWEGSVGHHEGAMDAGQSSDIDGETYVIIGIKKEQTASVDGYGFYKGVPTIQRNAYAGGEGGAVFGTAHITLNNGYVGYVYNPTATDDPATDIDEHYEEKLHDETWTDHVGLNRLEGSGNVFGGGYIDNSSVDFTNVQMWGGYVRNSLFGGGEIAAIGRGKVTVGGYKNSERQYEDTYKQGKTHVEMYDGHVKRDVFGGGKGYDNLGRVGTLYTDGYVFGQTEVYIRGGEVGTSTNFSQGYGNVFGGGDIGFVYGVGEADTSGDRPSPNHYYYKLPNGKWSEDCKVVVEPWTRVKAAGGVTIGGTHYAQNEYVPTDKLNMLRGKGENEDKAIWEALDDKGIIIRNAVFAGGNVDVGSDKIYANTVTVFGNVTATLRDVYRRDLITIGTEHTGGLYGGGNLSLVNGYRELHVANYGTDYYGLQQEISMEEYNKLTDRERAYFRLRFTCQQRFDGGKDDEGITYKGHEVGDQIYEDEYNDLPDAYKTDDYWKQDGVCSIYAGRLLNTLQRADFAGIYGSRMVLQGARDRVTDVVDYTRYTINRIGELSLMKMDSPIHETDPTNATHGNYFGIYSLVNYLGNMTSDVLMTDTRQSDGSDTAGGESYYEWKSQNKNSRKRNTAICRNQVALASGVFLELTTENSTSEHKDYGYITGVVELDLINAKADEVGGGYVYAKNEHGKRQEVSYTNVTLSSYNATARTYKMYRYSEAEADLEEIQTSGNFIHGHRKTIIDDCYPNNLEYTPSAANYSEAHYWYVKGSIYIYDQVLSAYTGSPTAYTRERHIPLTITAGSHGQLKLVNVQPNLYAYYDVTGAQIGEAGVKVNNNSQTFMLNDVITYWDWSQLPENERRYFVPETIVAIDSCTYTNYQTHQPGQYAEGTVMLPEDYETFKASLPTTTIDGKTVHYVYDPAKDKNVDVDDVFRPSNNISHNTGYVISFDMNTPGDWDKWYTPKNGSGAKISSAQYNALSAAEKNTYIEGPTFRTSQTGVYGQRMYDEGEIITQDFVSKYHDPGDGKQADVQRAYVTSEPVTYTVTEGGQAVTKTVNEGMAISKSEYDALPADAKAKFAEAMVCINTLKFNDENYLLYGELVNEAKIQELAAAFNKTENEIKSNLSNAYIVKKAGLYGGTSYSSGTNYDALDGWASLTSSDRATNRFTFNYDGFDVLADPEYTGDMTKYGTPYSEAKDVEYVAIYNSATPLTFTNLSGASQTIHQGDEISRAEYVNLPNEKYHYTPIRVSTTSAGGDDYYIAKEAFSRGNVPYAKGQVITSGTYRALSDKERNDWVEVLHFTNTSSSDVTYFYCREDYTGTTAVTNVMGSGAGTNVKAGWVISQADYASLPNAQKDFTIKGNEPTERTTLYVSRESNINDLSKEKIISVIYQYTYNEGSEDGENVELVNELHIINIHLQFESGAPIVDPLQAPGVVLPGNTVGLKQPNVTPGAYELLGGGWEIFENYEDAQHHRNGEEYNNNRTPMYWYQNEKYYVAYYAKSYLGKTYSNPVPFSVANYHDLAKVMEDTEHHMYVDYDPELLVRPSKIYINDYTADGKNGLDVLKDFINLSNGHGPAGHAALNTAVKGGEHLDFILRTNINHPEAWTSIGSGADPCFAGTLHGDGYTISGLNHSLFDKLCGSVYNLGVTGSFSEAGVANSGDGYVENCWITTTGSPAAGTKAVFGNPSNSEGRVQVVNSYYPESNSYAAGLATKMPDKAFHNGTVAYNLNGFYLNKRYYDQTARNGESYRYIAAAPDGTLPASEKASEAMTIGYYPMNHDAHYGNVGYVEDRYNNVDFIYAGGSVPETVDARQRATEVDGINVYSYAPIWPDDYLFFGQMLSYGYNPLQPYETQPSHLNKRGGRLLLTEESNRVFRAPAYFQSHTMDVAHFNPWANLAAVTSDGTQEVYPGMTAIDFTGHNDVTNGYTQGKQGNVFYGPLLDNNGLVGIANRDLTKNLLIYVPEAGVEAASADGMTRDVVMDYVTDPDYSHHYSDANGYRTVSENLLAVNNHMVERTEAGASTYQSIYDHYLVDKNDFNAPISYTFKEGKRMWYQRKPELYVDKTSGWETVSLPFSAELVSTQDKGELTHFYSGSRSVDGETKIGHEYWLREYKGKKADTGDVFTAIFNYPTAAGDDKVVTNHFLWDYYYSANNQHDLNTDTYQTYYQDDRHLTAYPLLTQGKPYIIGFPGKTYYEFDLSGQWRPLNTASPAPAMLPQQTITFASAPGITIGVSDNELSAASLDGYSFMPNYMSKPISSGYLMDVTGKQFDGISTATAPVPFRPYFVAGAAGSRKAASTIIFDGDGSSFAIGDDRDPSEGEVGTLTFFTKRHVIGVTSTLREAADVQIYNMSGQSVTSFTILPGETVERDIPIAAVYIVRAAHGRYTKKIAVK